MSEKVLKYRYPGARPFTSEQKQIFFGRTRDIESLCEFLSLENLVVLFSKSGLGKSSLINAGIIPKIRTRNEFHPFSIRFGAFTEEQEITPLDATCQIVTIDNKRFYLNKLIFDDTTLWYQVKKRQFHESSSNKGILLIFDQFEELFTYPKDEIIRFKKELKEVLNNQIPQRYRDILESQFAKDNLNLSEEELEFLHRDLEVKVLFAIRSDRMSLLNELKDFLPNILRHCYELDALSIEEAEDSILKPARQKGQNFISPTFDYDDEALDSILKFLTKNHTQKIESFQLQILCHSIEKKVIIGELKLITVKEIGDIESIYKNHYDNLITEIGTEEEQLAARKLIEEGLIFENEERRISLYEGQIIQQFGISPELLKKLIDTHIIRREKSGKGGMVYELSHDTLISPILKVKDRRIRKEKEIQLKIEEEQREKELLKAEQRAQQEQKLRLKAEFSENKAKQRSKLILFISIIGFTLLGLAGKMYLNTLKAQKEKIEQEKKTKNIQKQIDSVTFQNQELEKRLQRIENPITEDVGPKVDSLQNTLLKKLIVPKADVIEIEKKTERTWYRFKLWLEVPYLRKKEIDSVFYYFDHPSFELHRLGKKRKAEGEKENFKYEYPGFGCLSNVKILIETKSGTRDTLDFDMCNAIVKIGKRNF